MCRVRCENTDVGCITRRIPSPILTIFCSDRGLNRPRRTLLCITTAMYIATFACWIAMLVGQFKTLHNIKNGLTNAYNWLPPSECFSWRPVENIPKYCTILFTPEPSPSDLEWPSTEECVGTITLSFNVSFSFFSLLWGFPSICLRIPAGLRWRCYRMVEGVGPMGQETPCTRTLLPYLTRYIRSVIVSLLPAPPAN